MLRACNLGGARRRKRHVTRKRITKKNTRPGGRGINPASSRKIQEVKGWSAKGSASEMGWRRPLIGLRQLTRLPDVPGHHIQEGTMKRQAGDQVLLREFLQPTGDP